MFSGGGVRFKRLLRKVGSLSLRMGQRTRTCYAVFFWRLLREGIHTGRSLLIERGVTLKATDGGRVFLGNCVSLGKNVKIEAKHGDVVIGDDVFIGDGSLIVAQEHIEIGAAAQIAEYVVIRDQDHRFDTRPVKDAGFNTSPIVIGADVWIGCKTTVLKGSQIGEGAVIAAHSLVRGEVPPFTLAAGTPAKVKKQLTGSLHP